MTRRMKMPKKLTKPQIRKLAKEIRQFLLDREMWVDVTIYFNGMAYSTSDGQGHYYYNDPEHLVELQGQDPKNVCDYVGPYLTMTFEGDFYEVMNGYKGRYGWTVHDKFVELLRKYGLYYELGNSWNLSVFDM
jgi:uncharacterized protein YyaL (SSP411 family)